MLRKMLKNGLSRKEELPDNPERKYQYKLNNQTILKICKVEELTEFVRKQQRKYLAHLARQPNSTTTKRLLFNDDKSRKRGNTQKTLEQQVLHDMNISADEFYKNTLKRVY